jgi:hypothetical protein
MLFKLPSEVAHDQLPLSRASWHSGLYLLGMTLGGNAVVSKLESRTLFAVSQRVLSSGRYFVIASSTHSLD